jgi:hypothetical protein
MLRRGTGGLTSWRFRATAASSSVLLAIVACSSGPTSGGTDGGSDSAPADASLPPDSAASDASRDDTGPSVDGSSASDATVTDGSSANDAAVTDGLPASDGAVTDSSTANDAADADGSTASCPQGNGTYCGQTVGANSTTIYNCVAGQLGVSQECVGTCNVNPPGQPPSCPACPSGNGLYCGSSIGKDPNTLYTCASGALTVAQLCASACVVGAPGVADACGPCPSGDGLYCGVTLRPTLDPKALYKCTGGRLTVMQQCASTCHVADAGQNPYCL